MYYNTYIIVLCCYINNIIAVVVKILTHYYRIAGGDMAGML